MTQARLNLLAVLLTAIFFVGCDIGSPQYIRNRPAGTKKWSVVAIYEIKKKSFAFPQQCLFKNHVPFDSDYFDDDEPNAKLIVLRVAKSDFPKVQALLTKDAKEHHYELIRTASIEKMIDID